MFWYINKEWRAPIDPHLISSPYRSILERRFKTSALALGRAANRLFRILSEWLKALLGGTSNPIARKAPTTEDLRANFHRLITES